MNITGSYDCVNLTLSNGRITSFIDNFTGVESNRFHSRLTAKKQPKIYILKEGDNFLYVGTTTQSLSIRFRQGFTATGKGGYHGYKWRDREKVQLYVWCFPEFDKIKIESIEAEVAFLIRKSTGEWPLAQTEIHFNNEFKDGGIIAVKIFQLIS